MPPDYDFFATISRLPGLEALDFYGSAVLPNSRLRGTRICTCCKAELVSLISISAASVDAHFAAARGIYFRQRLTRCFMK